MQKQVLIVEDEHLLARTLGTALREAGYNAVIAHSAEQGKKKWSAQTFDLVILDNRLPKANGIEMLEAARQDGLDSKVILMSAYDANGVQKRMAELSVDLYVRKPFDLNSMLANVEALLGSGSNTFTDRGAPR